VLSGARVGYEEKPSAQAGTLLMNMLGVSLSGFNETGSKVLQGLFQVAAFTFLFVTIRWLYGTLAAVIAVAVTSIYLSAPVIAKFGNVKEQFMIAFMIAGICSFVWYHLTGKWWWIVLTGVLLIWGPMFKQTGVSAIGSVGLFTVVQPILRRYGWKKAAAEIGLLVAGALITLTPVFVWYASMDTPLRFWPYSFVAEPLLSAVGFGDQQAAEPQPAQTQQPAQEERPDRGFILSLLPGYVSNSWAALDAEARTQVFWRVLRCYGILILPIALALSWRRSPHRAARQARPAPIPADQDRPVRLLMDLVLRHSLRVDQPTRTSSISCRQTPPARARQLSGRGLYPRAADRPRQGRWVVWACWNARDAHLSWHLLRHRTRSV
jgi:4-amino-4-deoxy-L-arabinose transferase-like glycosyltransferase